MPMTNSGLSAAIKGAIEGLAGAPTDPAELQNFCDALGEAIVEYIQSNAIVVGEVTSGTGAGGTVTGTVE